MLLFMISVPSTRFISSLQKQFGYTLVAGVDEVGCGCLAGPVVSAAVILRDRAPLPFLRDSKQLSSNQREAQITNIKRQAVAWCIGSASVEEIDALGIRPATLLASQRALLGLSVVPDAVVSDAFFIPGLPFPCHPLVRADAHCRPVAAASVLAKVYRDTLLDELDARFPGYGFGRHKGYGTKEHLTALETLGSCEVHRRSFAPVKKTLGQIQ